MGNSNLLLPARARVLVLRGVHHVAARLELHTYGGGQFLMSEATLCVEGWQVPGAVHLGGRAVSYKRGNPVL